MMPLTQHAFANRSSVAPPDIRITIPSQPAAAQIPSQAEKFPSYQESDFMGVGDNLLRTPTWLQSEGQVNYPSMTQHLLQAKRNLQKIASAVLKSQEARRAVQGGVMKKMQELEAKCGTMKSSKARNEGLVDFGAMTMSALAAGDRDAGWNSLIVIVADLTPKPAGTVEVMEEMVITQSHALNVLKNKKGRSKKHDKNAAAASCDQSGISASTLVSDVSDGTDEPAAIADASGAAADTDAPDHDGNRKTK